MIIKANRNGIESIKINRTTITKKQKREEKQLYGFFKRQTNEISHKEAWTCQRNGNFIRETESLQKAAWNNTIKTNYVKAKIDKTQQNSNYRLCD